ncbi:hypothetical protein OH76DRAFT_94661 [Lentinus brumalis]|uniref:Uncharacterized protein n=1 Tax=Lentinus brumalis TaxID=2498619 RepID=A0A371CQN9_9APHY|nr:hypothetical protein OH76DRAFT_94661 [Polyporus brumalis]
MPTLACQLPRCGLLLLHRLRRGVRIWLLHRVEDDDLAPAGRPATQINGIHEACELEEVRLESRLADRASAAACSHSGPVKRSEHAGASSPMSVAYRDAPCERKRGRMIGRRWQRRSGECERRSGREVVDVRRRRKSCVEVYWTRSTHDAHTVQHEYYTYLDATFGS